MHPLLFFPALFGGLILMLAVVNRWEKRMVWAYGKPELNPQFGDPAGCGAAMIGAAVHAGFTFYGWAPDLKGPKYRVNYAILVSPDNIRFTDSTETYWRYTLYGGLKLAMLNYSIGMLRALTFGRVPRTA